MKRIGGLGGVSPEILIWSVSFRRFYELHGAGEWEEVAREMIRISRVGLPGTCYTNGRGILPCPPRDTRYRNAITRP